MTAILQLKGDRAEALIEEQVVEAIGRTDMGRRFERGENALTVSGKHTDSRRLHHFCFSTLRTCGDDSGEIVWGRK